MLQQSPSCCSHSAANFPLRVSIVLYKHRPLHVLLSDNLDMVISDGFVSAAVMGVCESTRSRTG